VGQSTSPRRKQHLASSESLLFGRHLWHPRRSGRTPRSVMPLRWPSGIHECSGSSFLVPFQWPVRYRPLHLLSYAASFSLGSNWQCKISTLLYSISFKDFESCSNTVHIRREYPIWTSLFSNCVYPGTLTACPVSRGDAHVVSDAAEPSPTSKYEVRLQLEAIAASIDNHIKRCSLINFKILCRCWTWIARQQCKLCT
jgi:hypothetical protein